MHLSRLGDEKFVNGHHIREYVPESAEEEIEEIRQRIAANNKAATRVDGVLESKESEEICQSGIV
jgi:hypothetical protein